MAWTSELQDLASRNPFIERLVKLGYDVGFINAHLVIFGVPYLNAAGELKYMDLISPLDLRENNLIDAPSDHKVYFAGEIPCNIDGQKIAAGTSEEARKVSDDIGGTRMLSSKPEGMRAYNSIEEKITQYLDLITAPALLKYPGTTPRRALQKHLEAPISPLMFPDSLSAREGVVELSHKLRGRKVGVIGCGGTGAYVLDYLAKTHLEEIHLYDDDIVHVHTLFRLPGVYGERHLGARKVDALADTYGHFHCGIRPHPQRVGPDNIDVLNGLDFVFVCVDERMAHPQWVDLGIYLQSLMLLAVEHGLATCAQGFWRRHAGTLQRELQLPAPYQVAFGVALGYEDGAAPINAMRATRAAWEEWGEMRGFG